MKALGWKAPDVILVSGDTYIDSPFMGVSVIGNVLADRGFKVAVIAQPDVSTGRDIMRLGEPRLFWGITGGSVDSMVANYTALKKKRKSDDFTPGSVNNRRPDRAVIAYANLIRRYFKQTRPIVLGGIEASLRRIAHYDFWSDKIRRSILFDAKADYLLFGMAHRSVVELARALEADEPVEDIKGLAYISKKKKGVELPAFEDVSADDRWFIQSFEQFYRHTDPSTAKGLCQKHGDRYLILNPPQAYSSTQELDAVHDLDYERSAHPFYAKQGEIRALDTIRFSIPVHYGCYGECNFCAITVHQGRVVRFRSPESIVRETREITKIKGFKGYITDLGGPTANMYGFECRKKLEKGPCHDKRCLFPKVCASLSPDHRAYLDLIEKVESQPGIKKVFISSGIRYDLIDADKKNGRRFLKKLVHDNISGQMKIAPEHTCSHVLKLMGKQDTDQLKQFKTGFDTLNRHMGKKQFLTYYLIAGHPGCSLSDMKEMKQFVTRHLKISPEQVQIFTPTPSTWSTLMYHTGINPFTSEKIFVEKNPKQKQKQKQVAVQKPGIKKKRQNKKR